MYVHDTHTSETERGKEEGDPRGAGLASKKLVRDWLAEKLPL